jgi:hypothetical protein
MLPAGVMRMGAGAVRRLSSAWFPCAGPVKARRTVDRKRYLGGYAVEYAPFAIAVRG